MFEGHIGRKALYKCKPFTIFHLCNNMYVCTLWFDLREQEVDLARDVKKTRFQHFLEDCCISRGTNTP